jgi:predicted methyltransferase
MSLTTLPLRGLAACALTSFLATAAATQSATDEPAAFDVEGVLQTIAEGDHRSDENKARNEWRHPAQTLAFFGIEPDMTVVELSPGGGWYTEILAPFLHDRGTYYAAHYDPDHEREYYRNSARRFADKLAADPQLYGKVIVTMFSPPDDVKRAAPAGSADLVVTFRNTHNWMSNDAHQAAFDAAFAMLRPGGVFGVVQHRADDATQPAPTGEKGYLRERDVIAAAQKAGFVLQARSEINANPRDTRDHPEGVWNLPPGFRDGDDRRAHYAAIGESDRMTLRFVKPE